MKDETRNSQPPLWFFVGLLGSVFASSLDRAWKAIRDFREMLGELMPFGKYFETEVSPPQIVEMPSEIPPMLCQPIGDEDARRILEEMRHDSKVTISLVVITIVIIIAVIVDSSLIRP